MWENDFDRLNTGEKENFRKLCNYLMARTYVVRDYYDRTEKRMRIHGDYRFIERHLELFRTYLSFAGWQLHKDNLYGVIYLDSLYGFNRMSLSKFSTLVLLTLRLIFEEAREEVSLRSDVVLPFNQLIQKMNTLGLLEKKPSYKELSETMKVLVQHNIVDKLGGKWDDPDAQILIHPSILFIIPNDRLSALSDALANPQSSGDSEQLAEEVDLEVQEMLSDLEMLEYEEGEDES